MNVIIKKIVMEPENNYTDTWSAFVSILSNDIVTSDAMDDILIKAQGILSQSDRIFLAQNNDSCDLIIQKRFWLRWLIRRLLAICIELKKSYSIKKKSSEILELLMKKASLEPHLIHTLTYNFIIVLEGKILILISRIFQTLDYILSNGAILTSIKHVIFLDLEKASNYLFENDHNKFDQLEEVNLRLFGSEWKEPQLDFKNIKDPYSSQLKTVEIKLKYGHEAEILQEVSKFRIRGCVLENDFFLPKYLTINFQKF